MDSTRIEANSKTALQFLKEEELVLRECLYALQGVTSGERIHFDSVNKQHVTIRSEVIPSPVSPRPCIRSKLGSGALDALSICAEAGWLYRRIQAYVWRTLRANNDKKAQRRLAAAVGWFHSTSSRQCTSARIAVLSTVSRPTTADSTVRNESSSPALAHCHPSPDSPTETPCCSHRWNRVFTRTTTLAGSAPAGYATRRCAAPTARRTTFVDSGPSLV